MGRPAFTRTVRICETCGTAFGVLPCHLRQGACRFCSRKCITGTTHRHPRAKVPLIIRFQQKIGPETASGCKPWQAGTNPAGYGLINKGGKGQCLLAHRVAWEVAHGPIPEGLDVLHKCDNPPCVNTDHLFLGTGADNVADMCSKGRHSFGERNGHCKLTTAQVLAIHQVHETQKVTQAFLAAMFSVNQSTIGRILARQRRARG